VRLVAVQVIKVTQTYHRSVVQTPKRLVKAIVPGANVPLKVNQIVLAYEANGQYHVLTRLISSSFDPFYPRDKLQNRRVYYRLNLTGPAWLNVGTGNNKTISNFDPNHLTVDSETRILYYNGQKIVDDAGYITVVLEQ
jgi:hypothetical protein